jgi:putative ABC transport system permease protein
VLISRQGLDETGLIAPGSHAGQRFLFKVPKPKNGAPISDDAVADLKARLIKLLPEAQVIDYRETNPALTAGLDQATSLLSLMSLVALVLGAVGVAMAMRAHLQQRLDTIAIMKSLGASSGQIIKIYLIQTLLLGAAGGLLGVLLGIAVQMAFPYLLASLINVRPDIRIDPHAVLAGLGAGMLTTLLFTLPPLLDIRGIRPILILRRAVDEQDEPFLLTFVRRLKKNVAQIFAFLLILGVTGVGFGIGRQVVFAGAGRRAAGAAGGVLCGAEVAEVFSISHAAASAVGAAAWPGKSVPSGQSVVGAAGRARDGRHADHAGLPDAACGGATAAYLVRARSAKRVPGGHCE